MIQRGEAMALASLLHMRELPGIEMEAIDIAPVVVRGIHGKAGRDGAIGPDDDVVLAGTAVPFAEMHLAIGVLHDAGRGGEHLGSFAVGSGAIAIPAAFR